jgi:deoxyribodipyrimidine photo-lyase
MTLYEKCLFIFRRDLRIVDNIGLNLAHNMCKQIYPIFIFTPEQVTSANKFKSDNAVQFMIESLTDLQTQISKNKIGTKLLTFYGNNNHIIEYLIKSLDIDCVFFNADYTPYAIQRDIKIIQLCDKLNIEVFYGHDYYLHPPGTILNSTGNPYQKFTPFYEASLNKKVDAPTRMKKIHFASTTKHLQNAITLTEAFKKFTKFNENILVHGGRSNGLKQLRIAHSNIKKYSKTHNELDKPTSELSSYIKFGCISIREVYHIFRSNRDFIRQLFWRDFYANILFSFPYVLGSAMKPNYNKISWHHNSKWFNAWCNGVTGFPIVDAGMRQLNETGYMHNRARLIVSSFLVKTLLIYWQYGEKYFAKNLIDYDPASNNGNWQWIAGSGADSQPYFRIFNPWEQTKNYDPDCNYIKKWIPELNDVNTKDILNWNDTWSKPEFKNIKYSKPIVDYKEQKDKVLDMYKKIFN